MAAIECSISPAKPIGNVPALFVFSLSVIVSIFVIVDLLHPGFNGYIFLTIFVVFLLRIILNFIVCLFVIQNLGYYFLAIVLELSFFVFYFFVDDYVFQNFDSFVYSGYFVVLISGLMFIFLNVLIGLLAESYNKKNKTGSVRFDTYTRPVEKRTLLFLIAIYFFAAFVSTSLAHKFGIAKMGVTPQTSLPFKLGGAINYMHGFIIPFFIYVILDVVFEQAKRKYAAGVVIVYFIWCVYEMYVINSRGFIFVQAVMLIFYLKYRGVLNLKKFVNIGVKFCFVFILLFPVLTMVRTRRATESNIDFSEILSLLSENMFFVFEAIYERVFAMANVLSKYYEYEINVGNSYSSVKEYGNFSEFHTHAVDGFPIGVVHSSGSSSLGEAFLLAGWFGVVGTILIFVLYFNVVISQRAKNIFRWGPGVKLATDWLFATFILTGGVWTFFMYRLESVLLYLFCFLLAMIFMAPAKNRRNAKTIEKPA